jgi:type I restriction enzyme, S subunit
MSNCGVASSHIDAVTVAADEELPIGWASAQLGCLVDVIRGVTYRKEESRRTHETGLIPILRANNIQDCLAFEDLVYVPAKFVSEVQMLRSGDIVVAASSGSRAIVGKAAQLREPWHGSFGAFCFALRPELLFDARYVGWFLHTKEYRNRVSTASAGVNINNLRAEHIEAIPIRVPPPREQERIADVLDELLSDLDSGVASLERARETLKVYRASVLNAAIDGTLTEEWRAQHPHTESASELLNRILAERHRRWQEEQLAKYKAKGHEPPKDWNAKYKQPVVPDAKDLPSVPSGWCWATVDQLAAPEQNAITDGPFGSNLKTEHYTDNGPRVIRLQNIKDGVFADARAHISNAHYVLLQKHRVRGGDIVIAALGDNLPRSCVVPDSVGPAVVKADCIRFKPSAHVAAQCINFFLNAMPTRTRVAKIIHGVGRPRMNLDEIRSIFLPIPPQSEQEEIVEVVEDQLSVIDHLERDLEQRMKAAQGLRQATLRQAFSGKLVAQNPSDEPALELLKRIAADREARARDMSTQKQQRTRKVKRA